MELQHMGIIADGNRRWAKENDLPKIEGHKKGRAEGRAEGREQTRIPEKYGMDGRCGDGRNTIRDILRL